MSVGWWLATDWLGFGLDPRKGGADQHVFGLTISVLGCELFVSFSRCAKVRIGKRWQQSSYSWSIRLN
jgi:hypothetical protein